MSCGGCGAEGRTWPHRGRQLCDACLAPLEEARARELPRGEERRPLGWATLETRPITEREAGRRVRQFVGKTTGHDVHSFIMMRLNYGDGAHRPTKSRAGSK